MFGGDNELGNILQDAVKLKSCQMDQKRKTYATWPFFVQHTLFHGEKDDFKAWRQLPFDEKMVISERIKKEGNELFEQGKWMDADQKYEEAATLVHYCYSTDPGWRKNQRGIDDDVLVLVEDKGSTPEDEKWQKKLRATCALNIAACKQKQSRLDEAIQACDFVIECEPDNVKALYRRAESRIRPAKATAYDHDLAIKDLAHAHQVDPKNQVVEKLLVRLRAERKVQREKDAKTFTGMFDRGEIYDKEAQAKALAGVQPGRGAFGGPSMDDLQHRIDGISEEDSLEKRAQDAELLRDLYVRNGKEEEARALNEQIQDAKKVLKGKREPIQMDWDNPTPEMVEDAKQHGLDLTDPLVKEELKRVQLEGLDSYPEDSVPEPGTKAQSLEEEEDDSGEPIPWRRYFILFAVIAMFWLLMDMVMTAPAGRRHEPIVATQPEAEGFGQEEEPEVEVVVAKSMWSTWYEQTSWLIFGDADETEL